MQKNQAISLICFGIWLAENIFAHISGIKIFPNMEFVQEHKK